MNDILYVDNYNLYIRNITTIPLLNKEEEYELALKVKVDDCKDSAYKLITSNLRFVVKIAKDFEKRYHANIMDLIQEGNIGMMRALKTFEPERGFKFISYAVKWIRSYIQKFIIRNRNIASGDFSRKKYNQLFLKDQERTELTHDIDIDSYEENNVNVLKSSEDIDGELDSQKFSIIIHDELSNLNEKDRFVVDNRLMSDDPLTLQEIADHFKISREGARQLELRIKGRLKKKFEKNIIILDFLK